MHLFVIERTFARHRRREDGRHFLQMRLAPSPCIDDGEVRTWT